MIIGKEILRYSSLDSTNDEARRLVNQGAGEGLVVVAEAQTRGRGKPGSVWHSPPGNLYFSAVVKPYKSPRDLVPITLIAALAGRSAIRRASGLAAIVKWPNDLLVDGRKIGGILAERLASGELIIGLGINLNADGDGFPANAVSLRSLTGQKYDPAEFTALLTAELDKEYLAYLHKV